MRKKISRLLILVLVITMSISGFAYAKGSEKNKKIVIIPDYVPKTVIDYELKIERRAGIEIIEGIVTVWSPWEQVYPTDYYYKTVPPEAVEIGTETTIEGPYDGLLPGTQERKIRIKHLYSY